MRFSRRKNGLTFTSEWFLISNMSKVKAHIVFDDERIEHPEGREKMLNKIRKTAKISDVNEKRFEEYGILTGTFDEDSLDKVRDIPGVAGVEVDEERHLQN